jgi:hypothetical protein
MGVKSLISYGLLVLPVAVTLGVLLGLQTYRESRGWAPPFTSNKIASKEYCQLSFGISPDTTGLQYTCESTRLVPVMSFFRRNQYPCMDDAVVWTCSTRLFLNFHQLGLVFACQSSAARMSCIDGLMTVGGRAWLHFTSEH